MIKSFAILYQQGSQVLKQHLGDVIKVAVHVYYKDQSPNDGKSVLTFCLALTSFSKKIKQNVIVLCFEDYITLTIT